MDKSVTAVIVVVIIVSIVIFVNVITDLSEERPSATRGLLFPVLLEHWLFSPPAWPQRSQRPTAFFLMEAWHVLVRVASASATTAVFVAVAPMVAAAMAAMVVVVSQSDVDGARVLDPFWHRPVCQGLADP